LYHLNHICLEQDDLLCGVDEFLKSCTVLPQTNGTHRFELSHRRRCPSQGASQNRALYLSPVRMLFLERRLPFRPRAGSSQEIASGSNGGEGGGSATASSGANLLSKSGPNGDSPPAYEETCHTDPSLRITGSTGPMLVFESIIFRFSKNSLGWDYLSFRMWVGLWIFLILLTVVAFDLSALSTRPVGWQRCGKFAVPDVFFFSCLLAIGTFVISYGLKLMRTSPFFPNESVCPFSPTLGYETRGWLVSPFGSRNQNPWYSIPPGPAAGSLATILIFMDQQITAVIVNRKENKAEKALAIHLDLLVVAVLIGINSILGIPWFVAAPCCQSITENRVTGFLIFLLIGLSVFLTPVLIKHIPMPVLYGVFLFMGISSLRAHVKITQVHKFTIIQVTCLVLLWVVKAISAISILFPVMVLAMASLIRPLLKRKNLSKVTFNVSDEMDEKGAGKRARCNDGLGRTMRPRRSTACHFCILSRNSIDLPNLLAADGVPPFELTEARGPAQRLLEQRAFQLHRLALRLRVPRRLSGRVTVWRPPSVPSTGFCQQLLAQETRVDRRLGAELGDSGMRVWRREDFDSQVGQRRFKPTLEHRTFRLGSVQQLSINATGCYLIEASGAWGGNSTSSGPLGGKGALAKGNFSLTLDTTLSILVGQAGAEPMTRLAVPAEAAAASCSSTAARSSSLVAAAGGGGAFTVLLMVGRERGTGATPIDFGQAKASTTAVANGSLLATTSRNLARHGGCGSGWSGKAAPTPELSSYDGERGGWLFDSTEGAGGAGGKSGTGTGGFGGGGGGGCGAGAVKCGQRLRRPVQNPLAEGGGGYSGGGAGVNRDQAGGAAAAPTAPVSAAPASQAA
uniref:HCO3_cotransp domain-containing protein n=1 Tax=Macrostomum lignano TaxID=282301 RepID=A0A1I8JNX6_9PLAT